MNREHFDSSGVFKSGDALEASGVGAASGDPGPGGPSQNPGPPGRLEPGRWLRVFGASLVRGAGGRPEVVLPLYLALERAAAGQNRLLQAKYGRQRFFGSEILQLLIHALTFFGSVVLAAFVLASPQAMHPLPGVLILVAAHWLLVSTVVLSWAGPSLLVDDDHRILGSWPLPRRELLLARLLTLFQPALKITLVLASVPVLVYAVTGRPVVVASLLLLAGLVVQTLAVTFGILVLLTLLVRWRGRKSAQVLAGLLADGNFAFYLGFVGLFVAQKPQWFLAHRRLLAFLPPCWFTIWGDVHSGRAFVLAGVIGLVVTVFLVAAGMRLLVPVGEGETISSAEVRSLRRVWAHGFALSLRPMMTGREGWVVNRLLEAHLRDDWRFVYGLAVLPAVMAFLIFAFNGAAVSADLDLHLLHVTAIPVIPFAQIMVFMAASVLFLSAYSNHPEAVWIVGLGDLDSARLLGAQRAIIRGMVTFPFLIIYAVKAWKIGASAIAVAGDVFVLALQIEIVIMVLQPLAMIMPFSLYHAKNQSAQRMLLVLLAIGISLVFLLGDHFMKQSLGAKTELAAILLLLWFGAERWIRHRASGKRLNMDGVVG